jgi:predicted O-linked N-acetylglucosamine transferase (SPINDLY family)
MRTRATSSRRICERSNWLIPLRSMQPVMTEAQWLQRVEAARHNLAAGDVTGARREAEAVLAGAAEGTQRSAAHLVLAGCCEKAGDPAAALEHARAAADCAPEDALARYACAELQDAAGDKASAVDSLKRALELNPRFAQALRYLGILLGESGDAHGAEVAFEQALAIDPNHARAWNNLGNAQRTLGKFADAERSFARAVALQPDYALATANLAEVQRDQGETEKLAATLQAALAQQAGKPPFRPLVVLLAGLCRERGALEEAERLYEQAIELAPRESAGQWFNLGWVRAQRNEVAAARQAYGRAHAVDSGDLRGLIGKHLALPIIYPSAEALHSARDEYTTGLTALEAELPGAVWGLPEARVLDGLRWSNFFLAYQGLDDRPLQAAYARLAAGAVDAGAPVWRERVTRRLAGSRRLRVGFASAFFHTGTCGRYFRSWITDLDRERFEVFVYHLFPGMDEVANAVASRADSFKSFGGSRARPSVVAREIRADALDALVYPELGMDACTFGLAALRLAPRQYAGWGHPVTTGHPTIDVFLSSETMEPADAQAHYTERLVGLPGIGTSYRRLDVPTDASRQPFGLPEQRVLLLCPQSLWKIHPDNDALFAELLAANRDAQLVLFAGKHPTITDRFMRRLERVLAEHGLAIRERVLMLPQVSHDDYQRINLACDAMLDTLHWSGGNTSLDALACGLPVVTLPGTFMRGRQSAGMLRLVGVPELIARDRADYLAIAAKLIGDAGWRKELSGRIRAARAELFDRPEAVAALAHLLQEDALAE